MGYRHILNENGSITRKLRVSSKQRLKKHLKTLHKLREKDIVDDEYVYIRKNAFYNHIKDTKESKKLKDATFPKKFLIKAKKIVKKKLLCYNNRRSDIFIKNIMKQNL